MAHRERDLPTRIRRSVRPLGGILIDNRSIAPANLQTALDLQRQTGARLGEIVTAHGWADPEDVARALAQQSGLDYADARLHRPDRSLVEQLDVDDALASRVVPWAQRPDGLVCATPDPEVANAVLDGRVGGLVVVSEVAFQRCFSHAYGDELARRALRRTPRALSARSLDGARHGLIAGLVAAAFATATAAETVVVLLAALVFILALATAVTRLAALAVSRRERPAAPVHPDALVLADRLPPPIVSLLIPLYREAEVLGRLLEGLHDIDYPRDRLDVKLLIEEDDRQTTDALARHALPGWIEALTLPPGGPRTKPRALNVALDFCRGEIVGILDAEDRPDPQQIQTITQHLRRTGPEVAAVQCQLAYFNAHENWITRCFQIEYSIWFDVLLRGWQRLGLPIPLGGTSVYFRRSALMDLGGWDAHNVTEDADLGMRIARAGLRCDVVGSTTLEEANCRFGPWIRQRSRWLKGYIMTWLCHMRRPGVLWRDLGPAGFLGFQVLLLGGAVSYLAIPLFWLALMLGQVGLGDFYESLPDWVLIGIWIIFGLGQSVMLASAVLALWRRRALSLIWWVPTLPLYWTMGALAAWKAVAELWVAPYFWDKTRHGVTRLAPDGTRKV